MLMGQTDYTTPALPGQAMPYLEFLAMPCLAPPRNPCHAPPRPASPRLATPGPALISTSPSR